jgi:hypothetical protein
MFIKLARLTPGFHDVMQIKANILTSSRGEGANMGYHFGFGI